MRTVLLTLWLVSLAGCYASNPRDGRSRVDAGPAVDAVVPVATCPGVSFVFRGETYLENPSPGCGAARPACLVWGLEGDPSPTCTEHCADPAEAALRAFCTCRCDGPTPCACAAGEVCAPSRFSFGNVCMPSAIAR